MTQELETFQVSIQGLSAKGYGIASADLSQGKPVLVEIAHTVPGDSLLMAMRRKMRPPRKGRLLEVLTPSVHRVEPRCAHAQMCGGCCWQQMDYRAQLKIKQEIVSNLFQMPTKPIIPCEQPFGYRNKMEFSFSENRAGQKFLGLMIAQAEPYVFNVQHCHLCSPWFSELLQEVRLWWEETNILAYHPYRDEGTLRYITLREAFYTQQKMVILNIAARSELSEEVLKQHLHIDFVNRVKKILPQDDVSIFLRVHEACRGKPTEFHEIHLAGPVSIQEELHVEGKRFVFTISPNAFFQPNTLQAEKLYEAALSFIDASKKPVIYDLYCGTGTLTIAASQRASRIVGIELSADAVRNAKANAKLNNLDHISFYEGDVGKVLTRLMGDFHFERPDVVIVDPPRAGLDPLALHHIKTLAAKQVIYISCNPSTQLTNVQELIKSGYHLKALQPVDQFPHTYHIENIAYLELN